MTIDQISQLDELLAQHTAEMGRDAVPYGNHAYRVANLCVAFSPRDSDTVHKIAIAAALHDMGIWTEKTLDYLRHSIALARTHLQRIGKTDWTDEITTMILEHHKLSPYRDVPTGWSNRSGNQIGSTSRWGSAASAFRARGSRNCGRGGLTLASTWG